MLWTDWLFWRQSFNNVSNNNNNNDNNILIALFVLDHMQMNYDIWHDDLSTFGLPNANIVSRPISCACGLMTGILTSCSVSWRSRPSPCCGPATRSGSPYTSSQSSLKVWNHHISIFYSNKLKPELISTLTSQRYEVDYVVRVLCKGSVGSKQEMG